MRDDESILEAARSVRPFLSDLIPAEAARLDQQLSDYLAEATQGAKVDNKIFKELSSRAPTREWLNKFLKEGKPPDMHEASVAPSDMRDASFEPPLGDPAPVVAPKYVCPRGDYTWYQMSAGSPKQRCPTHQIALVLAP